MKKILVVLAMTLTGFISQAQVAGTSGTNSGWNMDTVRIASTGAVRSYYVGKTISVPTNFITTIQTRIFCDSPLTSTSTAGIILQGSMDNTSWVQVPLNSGLSAGPGSAVVGYQTGITTGAPYWLDGGYPYSTSSFVTYIDSAAALPAIPVAGDTVAVASMATAKQYRFYSFVIANPTYTYYRLVYMIKPAASGHVLRVATKYYLRKPY